MKQRILLIAAIIALSLPLQSSAQVNAPENLKLQPSWGPVGYDYVENYYIPDINIYYNVPKKMYVYNDHGRWLGARQIPSTYKNFDLYHAYKVVINTPSPWNDHDQYYSLYSVYRPCTKQIVLRDAGTFRSRSFAGFNPDEPPTTEQMQQRYVIPRGQWCGACETWDTQKEIIKDAPRNPNE